MMNKRTVGFTALNILVDAAEYAGIYFLLAFLTKSALISVIITVALAIIMILLQVLSSLSVKSIFSVDEDGAENENAKEKQASFSSVLEKLDKEFGITGLELIVVPGRTVDTKAGYTPAFNFKNLIVVARDANKHFIKGIIAHEIGHALSGLSSLSCILIRPTHLIASLIKIAILALENSSKVKGICTLLEYVLLPFYIVFLIPDLISVIPFMRADEYAANRFAVSLGYGEELRCFYYSVITNVGFISRLLDLAHPATYDLLSKINEQMELAPEEIPVYSVGRSIYFVDDSEGEADVATFKWYEYRAKISTDGYYLYMLGLANEKGIGTELSLEKAKEHYKKAAEMGIFHSMLNLSQLTEKEGDIWSSYNYLRYFVLSDEKNKLSYGEKLESLALTYFCGIYNCQMVSPAGKALGFAIWKARLTSDGKFMFVISNGEKYNLLKGDFAVHSGTDITFEMTIKNGEDVGVTFSSAPVESRGKIAFVGAIGKYTLELAYDDTIEQ